MCGIFGFSFHKEQYFKNIELEVKYLLLQSQSRGKDATGLAFHSIQKTTVAKNALSASHFLKSRSFRELKEEYFSTPVRNILGICRMTTHGTATRLQENQPILLDNRFVFVHNGIIVNHTDLQKKHVSNLDSVNFLRWLIRTSDISSRLKCVDKHIKGTYSIALLDTKKNVLFLASNTGSLYFACDSYCTYFASEKSFLSLSSRKFGKEMEISQIVGLKKIEVSNYQTSSRLGTFSVINHNEKNKYFVKRSAGKNSLKKLKKHCISQEKMREVHRCSKCILPDTTPFISFDDNNVCNYCHEYKPQKTLGLNQLKSDIKKRVQDDKCLVAFSGGRDSSYGLHFVKKELGLDPVAFTYDWGMNTDLGRRNQARLLGELQVEQILIAADIAKKRFFIKKNILAWLRKPHLGMIPLFMAGDKQCEYFADRVMKKTEKSLMIFFRGNEFEKEEIKAGFAGVKGADPGGVIHHLPFQKTIQLASFYGSQFILNPFYFNRSLLDSLSGFFSTFIQPHSYLFLWHYIPWDETKIVSTLRSEYDWEVSPETISTWRTDDASSSFYNYIYAKALGFTENDCFRSNQIRAGLMSRETGLKLAIEENKPRYTALQWYFNVLGLDGDWVLQRIDDTFSVV